MLLTVTIANKKAEPTVELFPSTAVLRVRPDPEGGSWLLVVCDPSKGAQDNSPGTLWLHATEDISAIREQQDFAGADFTSELCKVLADLSAAVNRFAIAQSDMHSSPRR